MEELLVNIIHYPVYTLGPGKRVGIWLQGCSIRCKGCMSSHTWEFDKNRAIKIEQVTNILKSFGCKRLTISGGEPFDQHVPLQILLSSIRDFFDDILVYTGYTYEYLLNKHKNILKLIDAIVDSPFIKGLESELIWKGSENQRFFLFNKSLSNDYSLWIKKKKERVLQIINQKDKIVIIGIPYQKDAEVFINGEI
ncbi:anaerobic ribonucleoside-triphosphate reductase activating protein [Caldicellulosiruptor bescii]|uniref:Anaerobic ribonucleoside-triphosphate reductase activating protein n=3 Tax=Caldicellulosiruptor bescii TaxID=31899 RepID=A0ABY1S5C9_CALBS|nr:4Fe-4S single cluster domain-containing protein [Caldicellulosiruptor bescii]ACM61749.1 putative radical activating enzyme [Caldicellulosiruptor bescii DSM 6725]PBC88451.1 anaerobic ribonucleoside-triphosphate reductase activating protein [Caldicellulosiruptor bescii]PBC92068.1 anaerobic ribonucleoside-triphosphate reductase activating protein [Caldicellulosiruptor bescii]PBD02517.1 anaerobic ribonucleoside-triphosphate reductase activating protein [Caldicellulosiruptor bescii]PBD05248.1 an